MNECTSNPCINNGTCVDAENTYYCNCLPGYSGIHCEIDEAVCNTTDEVKCFNGGTCQEGPGTSFTCICREGMYLLLCIDFFIDRLLNKKSNLEYSRP